MKHTWFSTGGLTVEAEFFRSSCFFAVIRTRTGSQGREFDSHLELRIFSEPSGVRNFLLPKQKEKMFPVAEAIHVLRSSRTSLSLKQHSSRTTNASQVFRKFRWIYGHDSGRVSLFLSSAPLHASRISAHALTTLLTLKEKTKDCLQSYVD